MSDNAVTASYSYVRKVLTSSKRNKLRLSFEVTPNQEIINNILVGRIKGASSQMAGIVLSPEGEIKLRTWRYPGGVVKDSLALKTITGTYFLRLDLTDPHTTNAEAILYAERIGGRAGTAFATGINWNLENPVRAEVGFVSGVGPYNLSFDKLSLVGDIPDPDWYSIKDHQGFRVVPGDNNLLWIGTNDVTDPTTHSEPTKLKVLSRYDYAKVAGGGSATVPPSGLRWSMP